MDEESTEIYRAGRISKVVFKVDEKCRLCVCPVSVFIKLHTTAQSGSSQEEINDSVCVLHSNQSGVNHITTQ